MCVCVCIIFTRIPHSRLLGRAGSNAHTHKHPRADIWCDVRAFGMAAPPPPPHQSTPPPQSLSHIVNASHIRRTHTRTHAHACAPQLGSGSGDNGYKWVVWRADSRGCCFFFCWCVCVFILLGAPLVRRAPHVEHCEMRAQPSRRLAGVGVARQRARARRRGPKNKCSVARERGHVRCASARASVCVRTMLATASSNLVFHPRCECSIYIYIHARVHTFFFLF